MKTRLLFFLLLGTISSLVSAQDMSTDTTAFKPVNATIFLKDGTQLRGTLLSESLVGVTIKTDNLGEIIVTRDKIDRVEKLGDGFYHNGQYWFPNPNSTRYFFAPSALPLRKGEGYYQNVYVFANSVNIGVTDHFSMGGGFVLNPTFRDWQAVFITPKFSFPSQSNVNFGVGAIAVGIFTRQYEYNYTGGFQREKKGIDFNYAGLAYGTLTVGDKEKNGSVGLGWGFADGNVSGSPVVNLAYMARVGRRLGLVTENWILVPAGSGNNSVVGLLSGGVRFFGERISADVAMYVPAAEGAGFAVIPYVDFVVKFGK